MVIEEFSLTLEQFAIEFDSAGVPRLITYPSNALLDFELMTIVPTFQRPPRMTLRRMFKYATKGFAVDPTNLSRVVEQLEDNAVTGTIPDDDSLY
jgi:hypothetical protein